MMPDMILCHISIPDLQAMHIGLTRRKRLHLEAQVPAPVRIVILMFVDMNIRTAWCILHLT